MWEYVGPRRKGEGELDDIFLGKLYDELEGEE
jgi:hypothetical protein